MAHSASRSLVLEGGFVSPALSQRAIVFATIVGFHVLLVYALATGLARSALDVILPPMEVVTPDIEQPVEPPPAPPPDVKPERFQIDVPKPDYPIEYEEDRPTAVAAVTTDLAPVAPVQPRVVEEPIRLVGKNQLPNTEDYYPASERRLNKEGAANVQVCVDERGKRQGEPTVTQSSGNPRFDEAALDVARDGRYARSARGATYVPNCHGFRIVFKMQKE